MECIKAGRIKHQPAEDLMLPKGPWIEVGTDIFEFQNKIYLLMIDYYSKWIEVRELINQTADCVIHEIISVFSSYGIPEIIRSDNGPCYRGEKFKKFAKDWCFKHNTSSPRYPQSNGMAERAVGTVKTLWYKSKDKECALLAYRSTPLRSGYSPGELFFGRSLRSKIGKAREKVIDFQEYEEVCKKQEDLRIHKWNEKHRAKVLGELKVGQKVWVKSPTDLGFEGVISKKDPQPESYWVKVGESNLRRNRKHLFLLPEDVEVNDEESYFPIPDDDEDDDLGEVKVGSRKNSIQGSDNLMREENNILNEEDCNSSSNENPEVNDGNSEEVDDGNLDDLADLQILFENQQGVERRDGSNETGQVVTTRSGRVVKNNRRSDTLYY